MGKPVTQSLSAKKAALAGFQPSKKNHLLEEHLAFASAMIDPSENSQAAELAPSFVPSRVTTVVESFTESFSGGHDFVAIARPSPIGTLILTSGKTPSASGNPVGGNFSLPKSADPVVFASPLNADFVYISQQDANNVTFVQASRASSAPLPLGRQVVDFSCVPGGTAYVMIQNANMAATLLVDIFDNAGATTTATIRVGSDGSGAASVTLPANTRYLSFRGYNLASNAMKFRGDFTISPTAVPVVFTVGSAIDQMESRDLLTIPGVKNLRWFRIVGQTLRVTFTGSKYQSGGKIAACEAYEGFNPHENESTSMYEAISKLPGGIRHLGATVDGAHVFLRPSSVKMFDPMMPGQLQVPDLATMKKLIVAGSIDDATQSVTVEVLTIIQYMTDYPAYASQGWTRPWHGFDTVLLALSQINPASENPEHLKKIRKFLSQKARNILQYALEHPEEIAASAAKLAAILG